DSLPGGDGSATDSLIEWDALVRRFGPYIRSEHQHGLFARRAVLDPIEADPVEVLHPLPQARDNHAHQVLDTFGGIGKRVQLFNKLLIICWHTSSIHITGCAVGVCLRALRTTQDAAPMQWRAALRLGWWQACSAA